MKHLIKLKVILLVFFIIFGSRLLAADRILPLPKPSPDKEIKAKIAKKKEIYPKKRPAEKKEISQIESVTKVTQSDDKIEGDVFIAYFLKCLCPKTALR